MVNECVCSNYALLLLHTDIQIGNSSCILLFPYGVLVLDTLRVHTPHNECTQYHFPREGSALMPIDNMHLTDRPTANRNLIRIKKKRKKRMTVVDIAHSNIKQRTNGGHTGISAANSVFFFLGFDEITIAIWWWIESNPCCFTPAYAFTCN